MIRSKKITIVSILAIIVSVVSLVSSSFALRSTLDNGVSSVMSPNLNSSAVLDFNVYLGENIEVSRLENCQIPNLPVVQDNAIFLSLLAFAKESAFDLSFSIVNEGDVDGVISQISVVGLPEGYTYQIEGVQVGDSIRKKSRIGVNLHLMFVAEYTDVVVDPISLDSFQVVFAIEK